MVDRLGWAALSMLVVLGGGVLGSAGPAGARVAAEPSCRENLVPVSLEPGSPATDRIFVRLCIPPGRRPATVQLLVHGITYNHSYWDLPDPSGGTDRYNYVKAATAAGYATAALDRIGTGASSHPASTAVTIDSNAFVVHQVARALRSGTVFGPDGATPFSKVLLVGHSYGTMTSWFTLTRYGGVDAFIGTGASHHITEIDVPTSFARTLYPARFDGRFDGSALDPGYLTTRPQGRYDLYYSPAAADPAVVAHDEATKDTVTFSEINNYPLIFRAQQDIRVPVLLIIGDRDRIFCGPALGGADCSTPESFIAGEAALYGPHVPCVEAHIVPGEGHILNASLIATEVFAAALHWADRIVSPGPGPAPGCPD